MISEFSLLRLYEDIKKDAVRDSELRLGANSLIQSLPVIKKSEDTFSANVNVITESIDILMDDEPLFKSVFPSGSFKFFQSEAARLIKQYEGADYFSSLQKEDIVMLLEKQQVGKTTKEDIFGAISEYERLFKAGFASPAEILTLSRFYPDRPDLQAAMAKFPNEPMVIGGPASVEMVDKEGHLITTEALDDAFKNYMKNHRTRNIMVLHCLAPETKVYTLKKGKKTSKYYPISEITDEDRVYGHSGKLRKVARLIKHQDHDGLLLKIVLKNKEEVLITPDHRVLDNAGNWIEARYLKPGSVVMTADTPASIAGKAAADKKRGKTLIEFYGEEKGSFIKARWNSNHKKGIDHPAFGKISPNKGKTMIEIMGDPIKAQERADKISKAMKEIDRSSWEHNSEYRKGKTWVEAYGHEKPNYGGLVGEKNPNWNGGISKKGYSYEFTSKLKWEIRKRDGYICQLCGKTLEEEYKDLSRPLSVHHIDYDKTNCDLSNLITTCCRCNSVVNFKREEWTRFFTQKILNVHNGTEVVSVEKVKYDGYVYNLEVEEDHSYVGRGIIFKNSDVQTGWALPAYINRAGHVFKSGVDDKGLYLISELRDDVKVAEKVQEQINSGKLRSYSIAGSAIDVDQITGENGKTIMRVNKLNLLETTICERGINPGAHFDILKSHYHPEASCADGSCLTAIGMKITGETDGKVNIAEIMEVAQPTSKESGGMGFQPTGEVAMSGNEILKGTAVERLQSWVQKNLKGKGFLLEDALEGNSKKRKEAHEADNRRLGFPEDKENIVEEAKPDPKKFYEPGKVSADGQIPIKKSCS